MGFLFSKGVIHMAGKKILNINIVSKINHYREILKKEGIRIEQIILFGSYAKGRAKKWSDIDLSILSREFGKNSHDELIKLLNLRDDFSVDIEPHPFHPNDLLEKWDPLAHEI